MWRFLALSIGILIVLVCLAVGSAMYGLDRMMDSEWYTVTSRGNAHGRVAEVRSYCSVIDWDVPYHVYVHGSREVNADSNLVFSDRADCGAGPHVIWISPTKLKIKTWPITLPPSVFEEGQPPTVFPPTLKRTKIGDISIGYATFTVPRSRRRGHTKRPRSV